MYIQKIPFTRSNISGYTSTHNAGQASEQHALKTEKQLKKLRLQLFLKCGRWLTQNKGWKQKPLAVLAIQLTHQFLCFIHPSYPQQGTWVLACHVEYPFKMDISNKVGSQVQHAPQKKALVGKRQSKELFTSTCWVKQLQDTGTGFQTPGWVGLTPTLCLVLPSGWI